MALKRIATKFDEQLYFGFDLSYEQIMDIPSNTSLVKLYFYAYCYGAKGGRIYQDYETGILGSWDVNDGTFHRLGDRQKSPFQIPSGGKAVKVFETSFTTKHDVNGNKSFQVNFNAMNAMYVDLQQSSIRKQVPHFNGPDNSYYTVKLDPIPRYSQLTFNRTAYVGEPLVINVKRYNPAFKQDIEVRMPTGSTSIKLIPIITDNEQSQISWTVPNDFGTYFPNSKTIEAKIACYDKTADGKVVYSKQYPVTFALNQNLAIPTIQLTVKDINTATVALTGDEKVLITNQSKAQYEVTATPKYNATIKSYSIQNGNTILSTATGIIDKPFSGEFTVLVTDSRGYQVTQKINAIVIEYRDPTITLSNNKPDVDGNYIVDTSGMWFSGSFGAVENTLTIQYRVKERDSSIEGDWITIPQSSRALVKWNSIYTVTGLDYRKTYVFQTRAIDKLTTAYSSTKTVKALPVFDWGENEINFNVPIALKTNQVLDMNEISKNVVLAGANGSVRLRPEGLESTYGELVVTGEDLTFNGNSLINKTNKGIVETALTDSANVLDFFSLEGGFTSLGSPAVRLEGNLLKISSVVQKSSGTISRYQPIGSISLNDLGKARIKDIPNDIMYYSSDSAVFSITGADLNRLVIQVVSPYTNNERRLSVEISIPVVLNYDAWR